MSRLQAIDRSTASGKAKELLDGINSKLGFVHNMGKVMANSPAALESYLNFSGALAGGVLGAKVREQIALLTAQENHCNYCMSAHNTIGKMVGLKQEQTVASRQGDGGSEKVTAALTFAKRVLDSKGHIAESDLADARTAGLSDAEITEVIFNVGLNVLTNYFNIATDVDIDFPKVSYSEVA